MSDAGLPTANLEPQHGWRFALPTLIGNTADCVALIAMLNHAPVSHKVTDD